MAPDDLDRAKNILVRQLRTEPWFLGAGIAETEDEGDWRIVVYVTDEAALNSVPDSCEGFAVEARVGGTPSAYS